jgi:hypothetical protein
VDNKSKLSYDEICRIIGHIILSSRSEVMTMSENFSILTGQFQEQINTLTNENQQLRNNKCANSGTDSV